MLKSRISSVLLATKDLPTDRTELEAFIKKHADKIIEQDNLVIEDEKRRHLFEHLSFGVGDLLEPLLADSSISEIIIYSPKQIYKVTEGAVCKVNMVYENAAHAERSINRLVASSGKQLDDDTHHINVTIPLRNGSYLNVNALTSSISISGIVATIRKISIAELSMDELTQNGTLTQDAAEFLNACVKARLNIVVSGNLKSGRTTLVNSLAKAIPDDERLAVLEQKYQLNLSQPQVFRLLPSKGVDFKTLVDMAEQMNADRLIVDDLLGDATYNLIQMLIAGRAGLFAIRSHSPHDTLDKLRLQMQLGVPNMSSAALNNLIGSSIDMIVHLSHFRDGQHCVLKITEVQGVENGVIQLSDIFEFVPDEDNQQLSNGRLRPTGLRPRNLPKLEAVGLKLPVKNTSISRN